MNLEKVLAKLWGWVVERAQLGGFLAERIPQRAESPLYYLGGMTVLAFLIQIVTGILLGLYYRPTVADAHESVVSIMEAVKYGSLVRSIHYYSGNAMILFAILHLIRVYFSAAYKKPRELSWLVGLGIGTLAVFAGFSGYLLRWDERAVGATNIGLSLGTSTPIVGPILNGILRGSGLQDTLSRFFVFHIALIPGLILFLLVFHIHMVRTHGLAESIYSRKTDQKTIPFFPDHILSEISLALVVTGTLFALSGAFPVELGRQYDVLNPTRMVLEPEWYFVSLYQFLKTKGALPIYGIAASTAVIIALVLVPFFDRSEERHPKARPFFTLLGVVLAYEIITMSVYGYLTPGVITSVYSPDVLPLFAVVQMGAAGIVVIFYATVRRANHFSEVPRPAELERFHVEEYAAKPDQSRGWLLLLVVVFASQMVLLVRAYGENLAGAANYFAICLGLLLVLFAEAVYIGKQFFFERNGVNESIYAGRT